jgi:hypothetical protein
MNTKKSSKLSYLLITLVVAIALLVYFYWSGSQATESITLEEIDGSNQAVGMKVLNLLNEINALRIDNEFFKDPAYQTLRDYTVEIPTLPVGRSNPFSPVPGMPLMSASTGR